MKSKILSHWQSQSKSEELIIHPLRDPSRPFIPPYPSSLKAIWLPWSLFFTRITSDNCYSWGSCKDPSFLLRSVLQKWCLLSSLSQDRSWFLPPLCALSDLPLSLAHSIILPESVPKLALATITSLVFIWSSLVCPGLSICLGSWDDFGLETPTVISNHVVSDFFNLFSAATLSRIGMVVCYTILKEAESYQSSLVGDFFHPCVPVIQDYGLSGPPGNLSHPYPNLPRALILTIMESSSGPTCLYLGLLSFFIWLQCSLVPPYEGSKL